MENVGSKLQGEKCRRAKCCPSVVCRLSVCLSVCLSSVTFVRRTQAVQIFGNISISIFNYLGHPLTSTENFTDIVLGEPLRRGS